MKKTVLFLSALALAANVYAADKFEAGTADAPNYYVLKVGRGTPYLAYSEEFLTTTSGVETRLHRTADLTQANIWEVTPGEAEGTVKVTAYGSTRGLMGFNNADGAYYGSNAVATAPKAQDVYAIQNANGTVSFAIKNAAGFATVGETTEFYTLDASNGSDFLGNWKPNDTGTNWTAFLLDMTNGVDAALEAVNAAVIKEAADAMVQQYIGFFDAYIANVPWVAEELQAGVDALKAYEATAKYEDEIAEIWNTACKNANTALTTVFNGKVVALKSPRRAALGNAPYVGTDVAANKYVEATTFADANADFTMTSSGENGGYIFYNEATKTYIGTSCTPVTDEASAQVLYPFLHAQGPYAGIAMAQSSEKTGPGLNFQSWANGSVSYWNVNDEGSIWALVEADDAAKAKDVIETNVSKLEAYVPNLPAMVADILTTAIDDIKALTYSETIADEANEIVETALASANDLLATGLNGIKLTLLNLRQNKFVSVTDGKWAYSEYNDVAETEFTFKALADGGYILYDEAADLYIGEIEDEHGDKNDPEKVTQINIVGTSEEANAMPIYPMLCQSGIYYGVALAIETGVEGVPQAINTNANVNILHTYSANDGGSIFGLLPFGSRAGLEAVAAPAKVQLQGIYDLQGRKLAAPVKGINIINGKKVLVK